MLHVCIVITAWLQPPSVNDKADNESAGFHLLEPASFYFTCKASSACCHRCLFLYKSNFMRQLYMNGKLSKDRDLKNKH